MLNSHDATSIFKTESVLPDLAGHLFRYGILTTSYEQILDSLVIGLYLLHSQEEMSDRCSRFFSALYSCGPLRIAADKVRQDITEKVKEKLNIDFIIHNDYGKCIIFVNANLYTCVFVVEGLSHVEPRT